MSGLSVKPQALFAVNVAVTARAALIMTVQAPVPVQPLPLQPAKVALPVGTAVNVTVVPLVYEATHVAPHAMPARVPDLDTVSVELSVAPVPVTSRDSVSPSAVKLTLVLAVAGAGKCEPDCHRRGRSGADEREGAARHDAVGCHDRGRARNGAGARALNGE
jgi:hypothetical protein